MKVDILASGSSGNCIALTIDQSTILVDVGIAKTKIEKRLLEAGITPNNIQAIFITHAHKDHTKGLPLANKYKIPVYAGEEEWKSIDCVEDSLKVAIKEEEINFETSLRAEGKVIQSKSISIVPFKTHHDAFDPKGYVIQNEKAKVSICLDTGKVDESMLDAMKDSDIYIIESNHEPRMVEASDYPNSVKARVVSEVGHLSNLQTAEALSKLIQGKGEQIYLTHLSSSNNMPSLAAMTTKRALLRKGYKENQHYKIEVI